LPRFISCSLTDDGINPDTLDSLVHGLEYRIDRFSELFSSEQRAALIAPLQYLFGGTVLVCSPSEANVKTMRLILAALRH
ncbi:MAG TPA: hypothetical protein VGZ26_12240, partial [Pirellulales bacterium]|nr:hypothetical protein [Pirellulales bacterium]